MGCAGALFRSAVALSVMLAAPAPADPPDAASASALEARSKAAAADARTMTRRADDLARQVGGLQSDLVDLAARRAKAEAAVTEMERRLGALIIEETALREELRERQGALSDVLAALQSAARADPPTIVVRPGDATGAARAAMILGDTATLLEARAAALNTRLHSLAALEARITADRAELARLHDALAGDRTRMLATLAKKRNAETALRTNAKDRRQQAERFAKEAESMRQVMATLAAERKARAALRPATTTTRRARPPARSGGFPTLAAAPVTGDIVRAYGERRAGAPDTGVTFAVRPGAQVRAVFDARVVFTGFIPNYGEVLILEAEDAYHVVLAGLGAYYARTGQSVLAGEPVGEADQTVRGGAQVYVEFRRNGAPIDPRALLEDAAERRGKERPA